MRSQSLNTCILPYLDLNSSELMLGRISWKGSTLAMHICPAPASTLFAVVASSWLAQIDTRAAFPRWYLNVRDESRSVLTRLHHTVVYDIVDDGAVCVDCS